MEFSESKTKDELPHLLSQILDSCIDGITLSDPNMEDNPIVYANEAFELITGYSREETIGRNCRFLQGDNPDREAVREIGNAIREQKSVTVTLSNYRKDGERFFNQFTIRPLFDRDGRLAYFLGLQHDITNQIRAEDELNRLNRILAKSA